MNPHIFIKIDIPYELFSLNIMCWHFKIFPLLMETFVCVIFQKSAQQFAMNIGLQVSESLLLVLLGVYLAVELLGLIVSICSNF